MPDGKNTGWLLAALVAALCAQFALAFYFSEPFPAVIMPGFIGSPPTTGVTTIRGYRIVAIGPSNSTFVLSADKFFNAVPHWFLLTDLPFVLDSTPAQPSGIRLRLRLERRSKARSDAGAAAFAVYAQRRLTELTGRDDWQTVRVEETRHDLDLDRMRFVGQPVADRSREFRLR